MKLDKDLKKMLRNILKEMTTESERKCEEYWNDTEAPVEFTRGLLSFIFDSLDHSEDEIDKLKDRITSLSLQSFLTIEKIKNSKKISDIENREKIINRFFSISERK